MLTSVSLTRRSIATKKPCKIQKQRVHPGYELGEFPEIRTKRQKSLPFLQSTSTSKHKRNITDRKRKKKQHATTNYRRKTNEEKGKRKYLTERKTKQKIPFHSQLQQQYQSSRIFRKTPSSNQNHTAREKRRHHYHDAADAALTRTR